MQFIMNMNVNKTFIKRRLLNRLGALNKSKIGTRTLDRKDIGFKKFFLNFNVSSKFEKSGRLFHTAGPKNVVLRLYTEFITCPGLVIDSYSL
jgi:hypothetical protein